MSDEIRVLRGVVYKINSRRPRTEPSIWIYRLHGLRPVYVCVCVLRDTTYTGMTGSEVIIAFNAEGAL